MNDGLVEYSCVATVPDVLARLLTELEERGIRLFAVIDHGDAAREAGLELSDEVVVIFGNPSVGTVFMQHDRRAGIDLPLRILIWDDEGTTKAAYTPPRQIVQRFAIDSSTLPVDKLTTLLDDLSASISR